MLSEAIEGFHERDPYRPFADTDPTTGENLVRVEIKENPPVLEWGVLIGDVLHNLRSSLDHLAYIIGGDPPPNEGGSEFPIFWSRTDYRKKGAPKIVGACDHAQAVIEDLQPYHRGDEARAKRHPLWFLHELYNVDKHRLVHVVTSAIDTVEYGVDDFTDDADALRAFDLTSFSDDRAVIARWPRTGPQPEPEMPFKFDFEIAFDEKGPGRGNPVKRSLPWVRDTVRDRVLARLAPFLS